MLLRQYCRAGRLVYAASFFLHFRCRHLFHFADVFAAAAYSPCYCRRCRHYFRLMADVAAMPLLCCFRHAAATPRRAIRLLVFSDAAMRATRRAAHACHDADVRRLRRYCADMLLTFYCLPMFHR